MGNKIGAIKEVGEFITFLPSMDFDCSYPVPHTDWFGKMMFFKDFIISPH